MEELLKQQTGYNYSLLIDNVFSAWKIAFLVNNIQEDTTVLAAAFTPYAFATQHKNIEYIDITLEGNIDPRMLKKAKSHDALLIHHFLTAPYIQHHEDICVIEDITNVIGKKIVRDHRYDTAVIDFQQLSGIKAATLLFDDEEKYIEASRLASSGIEQKKFWNFDLISSAFNVALEPNFIPVLKAAFIEFLAGYHSRREKAHVLNKLASEHKLLQSTPFDASNSFLFYPLFLIPELYCPKEEVYAALIEHGLDLHVHHKPVYKLSPLKQDLALFVTEDLYKAELSINISTSQDIKQTSSVLQKVLEEFAYRACSF